MSDDVINSNNLLSKLLYTQNQMSGDLGNGYNHRELSQFRAVALLVEAEIERQKDKNPTHALHQQIVDRAAVQICREAASVFSELLCKPLAQPIARKIMDLKHRCEQIAEVA